MQQTVKQEWFKGVYLVYTQNAYKKGITLWENRCLQEEHLHERVLHSVSKTCIITTKLEMKGHDGYVRQCNDNTADGVSISSVCA